MAAVAGYHVRGESSLADISDEHENVRLQGVTVSVRDVGAAQSTATG